MKKLLLTIFMLLLLSTDIFAANVIGPGAGAGSSNGQASSLSVNGTYGHTYEEIIARYGKCFADMSKDGTEVTLSSGRKVKFHFASGFIVPDIGVENLPEDVRVYEDDTKKRSHQDFRNSPELMEILNYVLAFNPGIKVDEEWTDAYGHFNIVRGLATWSENIDCPELVALCKESGSAYDLDQNKLVTLLNITPIYQPNILTGDLYRRMNVGNLMNNGVSFDLAFRAAQELQDNTNYINDIGHMAEKYGGYRIGSTTSINGMTITYKGDDQWTGTDGRTYSSYYNIEDGKLHWIGLK